MQLRCMVNVIHLTLNLSRVCRQEGQLQGPQDPAPGHSPGAAAQEAQAGAEEEEGLQAEGRRCRVPEAARPALEGG
jgi:hypothetical protein